MNWLKGENPTEPPAEEQRGGRGTFRGSGFLKGKGRHPGVWAGEALVCEAPLAACWVECGLEEPLQGETHPVQGRTVRMRNREEWIRSSALCASHHLAGAPMLTVE